MPNAAHACDTDAGDILQSIELQPSFLDLQFANRESVDVARGNAEIRHLIHRTNAEISVVQANPEGHIRYKFVTQIASLLPYL